MSKASVLAAYNKNETLTINFVKITLGNSEKLKLGQFFVGRTLRRYVFCDTTELDDQEFLIKEKDFISLYPLYFEESLFNNVLTLHLHNNSRLNLKSLCNKQCITFTLAPYNLQREQRL